MTTVERFRAMGTTFEVRTTCAEGHARARSLIDASEARCSRFLPGSELSRVNRDRSPAVRLSRDLLPVMQAAQRAYELTDGLVDIAVGRRVADWGYDRDFASMQGRVAVPPPDAGTPRWHLEGDVLHRAGSALLDLGGIAKGWVADRSVELGYADVVSAGGDLRSRDPATTVEVVDPAGAPAARLALGVGGLATSSIGHRRWVSAGGAAHHIIDPRTGAPAATPIVSATVIADTALEAEAGAKAVLMLGEAGLAWADRQAWVRSALAVWNDGNVYGTPGIEVAA